jgi:hypothetical protein
MTPPPPAVHVQSLTVVATRRRVRKVTGQLRQILRSAGVLRGGRRLHTIWEEEEEAEEKDEHEDSTQRRRKKKKFRQMDPADGQKPLGSWSRRGQPRPGQRSRA